MSNTTTFDDPDTTVLVGHHAHATYLLDPVSQKATSPVGNHDNLSIIPSAAYSAWGTGGSTVGIAACVEV